MRGGGYGKLFFVKLENTFSALDVRREKISPVQQNPRLILLGGFLGAGKTTLIGTVSRKLQERGSRVGLITNDQGRGLLDTASAQLHAKATADVKEISGGCFCCRLEELVVALEALQRDQRPDVILAEPVGSCTDLMATVILPLQTIYHAPLTITPLSVTLDARRVLTALGGKRNARDFHRDVGYIYRKQMEEAEWLIVNKWDLLDEEDRTDLMTRLQKSYPNKLVFQCSAK
jgi:G3E family GTPase